ncbi:MAG: imidazolonepropionase [Gemmatimonadota bacterium]
MTQDRQSAGRGVARPPALLVRDARVVTMTDRGTLPRGSVLVEGDRIAAVAPDLPVPEGAEVMEAAGRVLMPGFVDAHTHALWAGDRLDEFAAQCAGASYLDVLEAGGGIMSTVRAVRAASREELTIKLRARLDRMLRAGTTTMEVKSGYGLSTEHELKSLQAIGDAAAGFPGTVVPTALLGHAVDPEVPDFFERVVGETLPAVSDAHPGIVVDAYCERSAWPVEACARLFEAAAALGHPFRVHADQFTALGMTEWAADHGASSVDHLETSTPHALERLARSGSYAVALPVCGLHLDDRYTDGRRFLDTDGGSGRLVIATNYNPGSAPAWSMPLVVALAVRKVGLTIDEALRACTVHAARLLGFEDRGTVEVGARADLALLHHRDERLLAYELGGDPVAWVLCGEVGGD